MIGTQICAQGRAREALRSVRAAQGARWLLFASLGACAAEASDPAEAVVGVRQALAETVPSSAPLVARHGMTGEGYQREFDIWVGQGLRLTNVSAYSVDGTPRFSAIWEGIGGPAWVARHGLSSDGYQREFDSLAAEGFWPTVVEGYEENGEARYAAIWEQRSMPPAAARHGLTHAQYQQEFDALGAEGFRATYVQGYSVAGTDYYIGLWEQTDGLATATRHGMTSESYQTEFDALVGDGFRLRQLSGFDVSGSDYYAAIWEQRPGPLFVARHRMTSSDYQHAFVDYYMRGLRLKQVDGYQLGGDRYAAFWEAEPEALGGDYCNGSQCFSLERAADALERAMQAGAQTKYAFELRRGTSVIQRASGPSRTAVTPPALDFTVDQRYNPASVGKAITTVAVLQLLNQTGVSLDAPIYMHLPSNWNVPTNNRTITIAEVLLHSSGFRSGDIEYDAVRRLLETEIKLEDKVGDYQNANYAVLRVLAARLAGVTADSESETAERFISYVNDNIFAPLGISNVAYRATSNDAPLFYPVPPGDSEGTDYGDWSLVPGSAGPHISTHELTVFVDAVFKELLLPGEWVQRIRDRGLGFEDFGTLPDGNRCYGKGGFFPGSWNGGAELSSGLVHCDNGVSGMIVVNGMINSGGSMSNALQAGF